MQRRTLVAGLSLVGLPVARAQLGTKLHRVGILGLESAVADMVGPEPRNPYVNALVHRLRQLGYVYGVNLMTEPRGSSAPEHYPALAAELVGLQMDVIVAPGPTLPALKRATSTIPVVMTADGDPVGRGYVQSLAHPGGNFTGLSLQSVDLTGKRLALLKELVPPAASVGVLWDRSSPLHWEAAQGAARDQGWKVQSFEIRDAGEMEAALKAARDARMGALLVFAAGIVFPHARRMAELATRSRLPAMYELRQYVEAGGLISYGADLTEVWRQAAGFVDKILKGAKAADLAVEQPTKFEMVINSKTATTLDISIPRSLLLRANEVLQ